MPDEVIRWLLQQPEGYKVEVVNAQLLDAKNKNEKTLIEFLPPATQIAR